MVIYNNSFISISIYCKLIWNTFNFESENPRNEAVHKIWRNSKRWGIVRVHLVRNEPYMFEHIILIQKSGILTCFQVSSNVLFFVVPECSPTTLIFRPNMAPVTLALNKNDVIRRDWTYCDRTQDPRTQKPQYSKNVPQSQKPQSQKPQYSKTAVLKIHSTKKNRSTQKPQY